MSQSGLSRSIRALEDRLGVPLLIRKPKGVEPTAYGSSVVERARLILNEVNRSVQEVRAIKACGIGEIVFGVTQNYGFGFIPALLAEFSTCFPKVRVSVSTTGSAELLERVRAGALDFGFGLLSDFDAPDGIVIEKLRPHHSRVVARSGHKLAMKNGEVTPEELAGAAWATLDGAGFQRSFAQYFHEHGLKPPAQMVRTDCLALIRELAASTDMLAVLPPDIVLPLVEKGALTILDCEAPAEETWVGLVFREDGQLTPQGEQIVARLRKAMRPGA